MCPGLNFKFGVVVVVAPEVVAVCKDAQAVQDLILKSW
jgi:hypothetical protein